MARFRYQPTPNPDSIKITRRKGSFISTGLLAFSNTEEAESHPLARSLFGIDAISNVLILPEFLTVTKNSEYDWRSVWKEIERTLEAFYE